MDLGALVCMMDINVKNGTQMVSLQLRVIPRSRWKLAVMYMGISSVIV